MDVPTIAMPKPAKQKRSKHKKREARRRATEQAASPFRPVSAAFLGAGVIVGLGLGWLLSARAD